MKKEKTVPITVRIDPELKRQLKKIADSKERNITKQIRWILKEYLKNKKKER